MCGPAPSNSLRPFGHPLCRSADFRQTIFAGRQATGKYMGGQKDPLQIGAFSCPPLLPRSRGPHFCGPAMDGCEAGRAASERLGPARMPDQRERAEVLPGGAPQGAPTGSAERQRYVVRFDCTDADITIKRPSRRIYPGATFRPSRKIIFNAIFGHHGE